MAAHCGTEHHEEVLEPGYLDLVGDVVEHMDQPIGDFSVFPTLLVSRVARRHVTVVLSGDGGDELFAGYDAYAADRAAAATVDRLPAWLRRGLFALGERIPGTEAKKDARNNLKRFLEGAALPPAWQHLRWMSFLSPEQRRSLYRPEVLAEVADGAARAALVHLENAGADRLQRQLVCDMSFYLPENILVKLDLMGMAPSLEARVPYLDNEMIDLALRIPSRLKWKGRERKHILKRAYARDLPPEILRRGKQGFSMPLKTWLNQEWNPLLRELLSEPEIRATGLFEPATVARFVREHESNQANHSHLLWGLMVFQLWRRRFLEPAVYVPRDSDA
jgi:asparagine synthase (glutamine-hydrolysing)